MIVTSRELTVSGQNTMNRSTSRVKQVRSFFFLLDCLLQSPQVSLYMCDDQDSLRSFQPQMQKLASVYSTSFSPSNRRRTFCQVPLNAFWGCFKLLLCSIFFCLFFFWSLCLVLFKRATELLQSSWTGIKWKKLYKHFIALYSLYFYWFAVLEKKLSLLKIDEPETLLTHRLYKDYCQSSGKFSLRKHSKRLSKWQNLADINLLSMAKAYEKCFNTP